MLTRRTGQAVLVGLVVIAVAVGAVAVARSEASPLRRPPQGGYERSTPVLDVQQRPDGTWVSPLLPFAGPFPSREAAQGAVDEARRQGLVS